MESSSCHIIPPINLFFLLFFLLFSPVFTAREFMHVNQTLGLNKESKKMKLIKASLAKINKPFIKSIKSPDGDIIDCVLFHLQPAFDNPQLKATMPLDTPEIPNGNTKKMESEINQLWSSNGESCPHGTIPIRRTTESDIPISNAISKSRNRFSRKSYKDLGHEHAIGFLNRGKYYGAQATLNVWSPNVTNKNGFSLSQIWVATEIPYHDVNSIEAGWTVYPNLGRDINPRLFTYWTNDGYRTGGCYNLRCKGFIQTSDKICLGCAIAPTSTYNGGQFDIRLLIWKDPISGNWWLRYGEHLVGYWPTYLFPDLQDHATAVEFGGEVFNGDATSDFHTSTQMGSGHFAIEGYNRSSYVKNMEVVTWENKLFPVHVNLYATQSNCYDVMNGFDSDWGNFIFFGGPGKDSPNCP